MELQDSETVGDSKTETFELTKIPPVSLLVNYRKSYRLTHYAADAELALVSFVLPIESSRFCNVN